MRSSSRAFPLVAGLMLLTAGSVCGRTGPRVLDGGVGKGGAASGGGGPGAGGAVMAGAGAGGRLDTGGATTAGAGVGGVLGTGFAATGGSGAGGRPGTGGAATGGAAAGSGGSGAACVTDADCPSCGACGPDAVCAPHHCRQGACRLLCDECESDADCAIAYDVTGCCRGCPEAFPLALVEQEPCLVRPTEAVPGGCRPHVCPDACELPICAVDAQHARCTGGACVASRCPGGQVGETCRTLTEADLDQCWSPSDCIVVPYAHCCGSSKRAINRLYLEEYIQHPEWQSFDNPGTCATMGLCADDSQVDSATCNLTYDGPGRCELMFP